MQIAHLTVPGRGATNRMLAQVAQTLGTEGLHLAGTVQVDTEQPRSPLCDMDVLVLPQGPTLRISVSLGPEASGCRLDPAGLEDSVALTLKAIEAGADLVIINKFGKQEAAGRGFRDAISAAMMRDIPVLVGVNQANLPALQAFCGDAATALAPDLEAALSWARRAADPMPA